MMKAYDWKASCKKQACSAHTQSCWNDCVDALTDCQGPPVQCRNQYDHCSQDCREIERGKILAECEEAGRGCEFGCSIFSDDCLRACNESSTAVSAGGSALAEALTQTPSATCKRDCSWMERNCALDCRGNVTRFVISLHAMTEAFSRCREAARMGYPKCLSLCADQTNRCLNDCELLGNGTATTPDIRRCVESCQNAEPPCRNDCIQGEVEACESTCGRQAEDCAQGAEQKYDTNLHYVDRDCQILLEIVRVAFGIAQSLVECRTQQEAEHMRLRRRDLESCRSSSFNCSQTCQSLASTVQGPESMAQLSLCFDQVHREGSLLTHEDCEAEYRGLRLAEDLARLEACRNRCAELNRQGSVDNDEVLLICMSREAQGNDAVQRNCQTAHRMGQASLSRKLDACLMLCA
ncbi:hypothetical protein PAPYR_3466 [Paratrimastix pyriformis]|uniref:Four-helix bundle copper-binding protein n=1 Tax=Paratrimastix pyriformis TaxID=342808 RepID=A0ABQ8UNP1_9EUKA|nr:hypothetical protein PAPYR_3466 [Paratrimastix pyriformis]